MVDKRGDLQKMTAFALNEWDSKLSRRRRVAPEDRRSKRRCFSDGAEK